MQLYTPTGRRVLRNSPHQGIPEVSRQEVAEEPLTGLQIIVLGPGCARCTQLERDVREALADLQLPGELIHVDDLRAIARYGVMGTPALIVNGKVVSVGTTPTRQQIKAWLREAETARS